MVLFSWYLDYHLWKIMLKMGSEAILEDKNMSTKLKNIDLMLLREEKQTEVSMLSRSKLIIETMYVLKVLFTYSSERQNM